MLTATEVFIFIFTILASTEALVIIVALMVLDLMRRGRYREAILLGILCALTMLSVWVLKVMFAVPRPEGGLIEKDGYAFPSGHAAGVTFLAAALYYYGNRVLCVSSWLLPLLLIVLISGVSYSRILLGVHTLPQVLVGALLGSLWGALLLLFVRVHRGRTYTPSR